MNNLLTKLATIAATSAAISIVSVVEIPKAEAVSLSIANAGFEEPIVGEGEFTDKLHFVFGQYTGAPVPGWEIYDPNGILASFTAPEPTTQDFANVGVWNPGIESYSGEAPEGKNVGFVYMPTYAPTLVSIGSGSAGLSQTLSSSLSANTLYTLQVEVGNTGGVFGTIDDSGFPGYRVEFLAGGTLLAVDDNTLNPTDGTFETSSLSFQTPLAPPNLGAPLEIRLINLNIGPGNEVNFDNVRLEATSVPEPSSVLGLLAFSAVGASFIRKKKQACS
jgi:hypothetical protein